MTTEHVDLGSDAQNRWAASCRGENEAPNLTIHQWRYIQAEIGAIASDCPDDQMAQSIRDELFRTLGAR